VAGGAIAAKFTYLYPSLVKRLVLLAPAGLPTPIPLAAQVGSLPLIGELLFARLAPGSLSAFARNTMVTVSEQELQSHMYVSDWRIGSTMHSPPTD
jgi:pimeloyl-ACP methyl ester carboxylesterase